jgi:hypothetical protein
MFLLLNVYFKWRILYNAYEIYICFLGRNNTLIILVFFTDDKENLHAMIDCLFACFESQEQFFSYLATVTITGYTAANFDLCLALTAFSSAPVRIRVRIDPPHPLVYRKRRLMGRTFGWDRKNRGPVSQQVIPPCSKALSAEHRPKFCSPSPAMVTSTYKWNILERDVKP